MFSASLSKACEIGSVSQAKNSILHETDAIVNVLNPDTGMYPLMTAARHGHTALLGLLHEHGADLDAQEPIMGYTALIVAVNSNMSEAVCELVRLGASTQLADNSGKTAREYAENCVLVAGDVRLAFERGQKLGQIDRELRGIHERERKLAQEEAGVLIKLGRQLMDRGAWLQAAQHLKQAVDLQQAPDAQVAEDLAECERCVSLEARAAPSAETLQRQQQHELQLRQKKKKKRPAPSTTSKPAYRGKRLPATKFEAVYVESGVHDRVPTRSKQQARRKMKWKDADDVVIEFSPLLDHSTNAEPESVEADIELEAQPELKVHVLGTARLTDHGVVFRQHAQGVADAAAAAAAAADDADVVTIDWSSPTLSVEVATDGDAVDISAECGSRLVSLMRTGNPEEVVSAIVGYVTDALHPSFGTRRLVEEHARVHALLDECIAKAQTVSHRLEAARIRVEAAKEAKRLAVDRNDYAEAEQRRADALDAANECARCDQELRSVVGRKSDDLEPRCAQLAQRIADEPDRLRRLLLASERDERDARDREDFAAAERQRKSKVRLGKELAVAEQIVSDWQHQQQRKAEPSAPLLWDAFPCVPEATAQHKQHDPRGQGLMYMT